MISIIHKFTSYKNNINPLKTATKQQKGSPSFNGGIPYDEMVKCADSIPEKLHTDFNLNTISDVLDDYFQNLLEIMKIKKDAGEDERVITESLRDDLVSNIFNKLSNIIDNKVKLFLKKENCNPKDERYLEAFKPNIEKTVQDIKQCLKKWTGIEKYIEAGQKGLCLPEGFGDFEKTREILKEGLAHRQAGISRSA